jgi:hypothetical protein
MAVGVTSEHVRSLFGVPIMQQRAPGNDEATDYMFRNDDSWIVTREQGGAVVAWSITVTNHKLKIHLEDLTFGLVKGTLGHSRFSEVVKEPSGVFEMRGGTSYAYAERKYFGRPSAYQSFVFMYNDEGIGTLQPSGQGIVASQRFTVNGSTQGDMEALKEVRKATTVNTFISCGRNDAFLAGGWMMWPVVLHDLVVPLRAVPRLRTKWIAGRKPRISRRQRRAS